MTRRSLIVTIALGLSVVCAGGPANALEPVVVESDLRFPAGIAFDSAGTMYVTEREGRILAFTGRVRRVVASIPTITEGETGLLGIALSPDDRYVYVFATEHDQTNSIWRVRATGGEPERVITGLPGGGYHNGGGVAFGPDGNLYVSNGERHDTDLAQDPNALGGKVYRYTPDGAVPAENPFGDSPVWSLGHRNPFGIAVDPWTGDVFVTENGPEAFDEINRIEPGANYGWPIVYGPASAEQTEGLRGRYVDPILAYEDIIVPTGITFADPFNAIPSVAGDMFFGTYGDQTIHRVVMDRRRTKVIEDVVWYRSGEPIVAMAWGPRGLYYSTPGAVRLFELARREDQPSNPDDPSEAPPAGEVVVDDAPVASLLFAGAAAVLAGALFYAFGGKRKGRT
jgi:glucose/arabinose dehydrogenase